MPEKYIKKYSCDEEMNIAQVGFIEDVNFLINMMI